MLLKKLFREKFQQNKIFSEHIFHFLQSCHRLMIFFNLCETAKTNVFLPQYIPIAGERWGGGGGGGEGVRFHRESILAAPYIHT